MSDQFLALQIAEHPNHAVFAVKAAPPDDFAAPHPGHGLAQRREILGQIIFRHVQEHGQLGAEAVDDFRVALGNPAAFNPAGHDFADDFRQRDERAEAGLSGGLLRLFPVGQGHDPGKYPFRKGMAAHRA